MKSFFICCLLLLGGLSAQAAPNALVVVLLPGTSFADWQAANAPNLHTLMQAGAVAVMNTRTAHQAGANERETPQSALLTLGAGSRAAGSNASAIFAPVSAKAPGLTVKAGALYKRRTGLVPHFGQSVCVTWPAVISANSQLGYDLRLGNLAEALTLHGIKIEAGGGAGADLVAADPDGSVRHIARLQAAPGLCVVWDAGPNVSAADAVIEDAASQVANLKGRLIVISPYAGSGAYRRSERLTPVLVWGNAVPAGLLVSASTRRPGLVTNTDFAPSVADCFGIPRTSFRSLPFGFAWSEMVSADNVGSVEGLSRESVRQAQGMTVLPYLAIALGFWISAATAFTLRPFLALRRPLLDVFALAPVTALACALFAVSLASFGVLLPVLLTLAVIGARFAGRNAVLTFLAAGLTLVLAADMSAGNVLMHRGLLGYSAIEGARYYGIGNEAMGLLLSAALVAVARLWSGSRSRQTILIALMGGIVLLLGSAGAKAGGVLVSLAAFGTFLFRVSGSRLTGRTAMFLSAIVAAGMILAALGDAFLLPQSHSHIGEAVSRIVSGGPGEAWDIVRRKLAVEGRLAYHSAWAALLWPSILCIGLLWKKAPPLGSAPAALRAAGAAGLLACLLFNDAGVVAAALFAVVGWSEVVTQKSLPVSKTLDTERPSAMQ